MNNLQLKKIGELSTLQVRLEKIKSNITGFTMFKVPQRCTMEDNKCRCITVTLGPKGKKNVKAIIAQGLATLKQDKKDCQNDIKQLAIDLAKQVK